jgi:peptidoglycan/xylan/chitin deacetylase (PgdA/CDA1 family)
MMSDEPSIELPAEQFRTQFEQMDSIVRELGGVRFFRPGSGWYNDRMIRDAERLGYRVVLGSVYAFDAQFPPARGTSWYIVENSGPGSIIILHDGAERGVRTAKVLRTILPELRRRGLQVVTLSELVKAGEQVSAVGALR